MARELADESYCLLMVLGYCGTQGQGVISLYSIVHGHKLQRVDVLMCIMLKVFICA